MTEDQIKHMVDRFLSWKLPGNFSPDAGISFKADFNENTDYTMKHEPSGTNLFDATQADAMVRHMLDEMPTEKPASDFRWLIEAPGQRYLCSRRVGQYEFFWTQDHNEALAFRSEDQADMTMMAVRDLAPALFEFERTIGDAKAVEHGWM